MTNYFKWMTSKTLNQSLQYRTQYGNNMYKSETITRTDGTKYVQCIRTEPGNIYAWSRDQEQTARCIQEFGSSS